MQTVSFDRREKRPLVGWKLVQMMVAACGDKNWAHSEETEVWQSANDQQ
jgi:hypothetical protein